MIFYTGVSSRMITHIEAVTRSAQLSADPGLGNLVSILKPRSNQPASQQRRKDIRLWECRAAELWVYTHRALGQDAQEPRDPVYRADERRRLHELAVELRRWCPSPGIV